MADEYRNVHSIKPTEPDKDAISCEVVIDGRSRAHLFLLLHERHETRRVASLSQEFMLVNQTRRQ